MTPFRRSDWNDIIARVNQLAASPGDGCTALAPIVELPPNSIWRKSHLAEVHAKLKAVCDENEFTIPDKWQQSIIGEIEMAIARGWCNCDEHCPRAGDVEFIDLFSSAFVVQCYDDIDERAGEAIIGDYDALARSVSSIGDDDGLAGLALTMGAGFAAVDNAKVFNVFPYLAGISRPHESECPISWTLQIRSGLTAGIYNNVINGRFTTPGGVLVPALNPMQGLFGCTGTADSFITCAVCEEEAGQASFGTAYRLRINYPDN